jgi:uncharacterized protein
MLLEFTVENYRSIKGPVTLSAVAQKSRKAKAGKKGNRVKSDAEICPGFAVDGWDMELLPVMAIFGANASGKSNIIQALNYLLARMQGADQHTSPAFSQASHSTFALDTSYQDLPSKFDLHIAKAGYIYRYHVEFLGSKVYKETLEYLSKTTRRPRQLYHREWLNQNSIYSWKNGEMFLGAHIQLEESLGQNELFVSVMRRLNVEIMVPLIEFLNNYLSGICIIPIDIGSKLVSITINGSSSQFKEQKKKIVNFLRLFDVGLLDLEFRQENTNNSGIYAIHQGVQGSPITWRFEEESIGTQRLLSIASFIIIMLDLGGLLSLDELGTNLHPKITSYIIQLFQNPKTNPKGAQLIFTSHDNTLQRNQLLRRDEIWFTEKKPDQSTDLYSLADFKVRNDLAIDKAYLDGRFGAVPFLPDTVEELLGVE